MKCFKKLIVSVLTLSIIGSVSNITDNNSNIIADAATTIPAIEYPTSVTESSDGKEIILKWDLTKLSSSSRTWLNKNKNNTILLNYKTYGFNPCYGDKYTGTKIATKSGNTYTVKIRANKSNDLKIKYYDSQSGKTGSSKIVCVYNKTMNDNAFGGTEIWNQGVYYKSNSDELVKNIQVVNNKIYNVSNLVLMTDETENVDREYTYKLPLTNISDSKNSHITTKSNFTISGNYVTVKYKLNKYIDNQFINSYANAMISGGEATSGYRKNARTYFIGTWTGKYPASTSRATTFKIAKHSSSDGYITVTATTKDTKGKSYSITSKISKHKMSNASGYNIYSGAIKIKAQGYGCSSVKTYSTPFTYIDKNKTKNIKESTKTINLLYSIKNVDIFNKQKIDYTDKTKRSICFTSLPDCNNPIIQQ